MKADFSVDASKLREAARHAQLTADDLLEIGYAGSAVVKTNQKMDVAVDTGETKTSINDHIITSTRDYLEDDIGPETEYANYLEYGTGEFAESGNGRKGGWVYPYKDGFRFTYGMHPRPFVRPSAHGQNKADALNAIARAYGLKLVSKWQK